MFTFSEVAKILGQITSEASEVDEIAGKNSDEMAVEISSVEFDSRKCRSGSLFVPIIGQSDGHDYLKAAVDNGAVATLWSRQSDLPEIPFFKVDDTEAAFKKIAKAYLKKIAPKVIAITGSNGKTTTKDMTESVLSQKFQTYKTQGNYNNQLGLPYTILHMPKTTEVLVLEMGMDHAGEISVLTQLALPEAAAITLIGESHLEYFKNRGGIAQAKMEIVEGLAADGFLLVPGDEPLLTPLTKKIAQKVYTFQLGPGTSDLKAKVIKETQHETSFTLNFLGKTIFTIPVSGTFNVKNALIAAFFGKKFGLSADEIQKGLAQVKLTANRSQWLQHDGIDILSDVYNANPTAMSLVLTSFSKLQSTGKKVAVLGDMLELGEQSAQLHAGLNKFLEPEKIQEVFLFGTEMQHLATELSSKYGAKLHYYPVNEKEQLLNDLTKTLHSGDFVVVKGSNGMHLDEVVEKICSEK